MRWLRAFVTETARDMAAEAAHAFAETLATGRPVGKRALRGAAARAAGVGAQRVAEAVRSRRATTGTHPTAAAAPPGGCVVGEVVPGCSDRSTTGEPCELEDGHTASAIPHQGASGRFWL